MNLKYGAYQNRTNICLLFMKLFISLQSLSYKNKTLAKSESQLRHLQVTKLEKFDEVFIDMMKNLIL